MLTPYPPQERAIESLLASLQKHGACLNSSDTGTGKTLMAVEMCRRAGLKPLVICPKAIVPSWKHTFEQQGVPYLDVLGWEKVRAGNTHWGNWNSRKRKEFLWNPSVKALVFDEVHRAKGRGTQSSAMLIGAKGRPTICCSATASEDPSEMLGLGYLLGFHKVWDFFQWAVLHGCKFDEWRELYFDPAFRDHYLPLLHEQIYPERGYRVSRADMVEFFTRTSINTEPLDFDDGGKIEDVYAKMQEELAALEERQSFDAAGAEGLTAQLRARQKVELLKVPVLAQFTKEALEEGYSVPVFLNFSESIAAFQKQFDFQIPTIQGGQSEKARQQVLEDWAADKFRVLVCNMEAGGVGVNLHDIRGEYPRMALISPNWNVKSLLQVLGRVDRAGAKTDTIQRIFFAANTVEDDVRVALEQKLQNLQTLHRMHETPETLMGIDIKQIWEDAKAHLRGNDWPTVDAWTCQRLEKGNTLVLAGEPDGATMKQGDKKRITNAIRKAAGLGNLVWRHDNQLAPAPEQGGFVPTKVGATEVNVWQGPQPVLDPPAGQWKSQSSITITGQTGLEVEEVSLFPDTAQRPQIASPELVRKLRTEQVENAEHAKFNPSSWGYRERCPSYQNRTDDDQDLTAADAGTRYHKCVETEDMSHAHDDEERYHAGRTIQFRESTLASWGMTPENRADYKEVRLEISLPSHKTFGTCDHLSISKSPYEDGTFLAVAMDWKYGWTPVDDAEENAQVAAYTIGIFQKHPEVSYVVFYVVMPRQGVISQATFHRTTHYDKLVLRGETIYRRWTEQAGQMHHPSPSLCEWCGHASKCAALANFALDLARKYDPEETEFFRLPEVVHGSQMEDPDTVAKLRTITPIIKRWASGIEERANEMAFQLGYDLPGLKKTYRSTNRNIDNALSAYNLLVNPRACNIDADPVMTHDEFLLCVSKVGITELFDTLTANVPPGMSKSAFEAHIEGFLREYGALKGGGDEKYGVLQIDRKSHKQ